MNRAEFANIARSERDSSGTAACTGISRCSCSATRGCTEDPSSSAAPAGRTFCDLLKLWLCLVILR